MNILPPLWALLQPGPYEFARRWVAAGHKVTMITSTAMLTVKDLEYSKGWFFKRFTINGIDVIAMTIPYRQQMGVLKRCLSFFAFLILSSAVALFVKKIDIVYATSTPLTIGIPAVIVKWFRRKKFIFEVRDQWPESVVQVGVIKNRVVIAIFSWLEKFIYKRAAAIIAVSETMADSIKQVAGPQKAIYSVHNGSDLNLFGPNVDGKEIRHSRNWKNKLVLMHPGAMGKTNSLDFVIETAQTQGIAGHPLCINRHWFQKEPSGKPD